MARNYGDTVPIIFQTAYTLRLSHLRGNSNHVLYDNLIKSGTWQLIIHILSLVIVAADQECHGKIYKVYSDSQASLKTVEAMISTKDQTRLQRVQAAHESIRSRGATLELHWVAEHAGVLGNEAADKVADGAHDLPLSLAERQRTEVAARLALIQEQARQT